MIFLAKLLIILATLPETNSEFTPENGWLEDDPFGFGMAQFQGRTVSFRECNVKYLEKKTPGFYNNQDGRWIYANLLLPY